MANCVKCRFSLNLQLFSVVLKSASVKYTATYFPWDSHQRQSSCTSMSLWWQNNLSLWLSWTISIPKWVSILWHAACAPSDAKLLEGGVSNVKQLLFRICRPFVDRSRANDYVLLMLQRWWKTNIWSWDALCTYWGESDLWVFHNFVTAPNRIGWNNARVLWRLHSRLPHRVAEPGAHAHTHNVDGMCVRIIVPGCSSIKSIANTFHA